MESYYTGAVGAGEPPGRWHGRGAAALGLDGEVDADVMSAVYERYLDPTDPVFADPQSRTSARTLGNRPKEYRTPDQIVAERIREYTTEYADTPAPEQVQAWRLEAEKTVSAAAHFYDLTFSPDKSVTVLWTAFTRAANEATANGDEQTAAGWQWAADQVEDALMDASARALDYVERTAAFTRTGRHGARSLTGRWADTLGLTVARFRQHTSREGDPQLHVHQAVLNKAQTADGRWLALDGEAVHAARPAAAAVAERALEVDLTRRLGIAWEMRADGVGRRVTGVDPHLEDLFSARTRAIGPEAERRLEAFEAMYGRPANNIERATIIKKVTLATRPGKTGISESPEEMNERWHAEAGGTVAGGLGAEAHRFRHVLDRAPHSAGAAAAAAEDVDEAGRADVGELLAAADAAGAGAGSFSVSAVVAEALETCHGPDGKSTFTRHDLIRQLNLALPDDLGALGPDQVEQLLDRLADQALSGQVAGADVVQVSGLEVGRVPDAARRADGTADTVNPSRVTYATRGHLSAEWAVLRSAGVRGRTALPAHLVTEWLTEHPTGQALSAAQGAALAGLATSDAATSVLVGPAGTGKSFTAAAFDHAWRDLTARLSDHRNPGVRGRYVAGRAIGVALTQAAADVLADDGVTDSANIAAFLTAQRRLAGGRPREGDERWRLGPSDVLLVDEASMADTASLNRLQDAADAAGARVILMGDPHQLGPVGAGGMMRAAIDRDAQTYTLTEVRRFTHPWEADASLRLRDGHPDAITAYDAHGRLIDAGREAETIAAIARAAAADRIAGKNALVTTSSNEHAAQIAARIRRHLVDAGLVGPDAVHLDRDGTTAGIGDLVQARRIDRDLGLTNREIYRIDHITDDGTLHATSTRTGNPHTIPAGYVAADLSLAYASTAHAAEGATADTGHVLLSPGMDRAAAYVGGTRGRESNTFWAITDTGTPTPHTSAGSAGGETITHTARALLARALTTEAADQTNHRDAPEVGLDLRPRADAAAVDIAAADHRRRRDAGTLLGLIEDETRLACRARLDTHLDQLHADGTLSETERARFGAEQGTQHLARLLRAHEHAGHDPYTLLRDGVTAGTLTNAVALSQVIAARIDKRHPLPAPTTWTAPVPAVTGAAPTDADAAGAAADVAPADVGSADRTGLADLDEPATTVTDDRAAYLAQVRGLYAARERELGEHLTEQAATDPTGLPGWIHTTLGPVPAHDDTNAAVGQDTAGQDTGHAAAEAVGGPVADRPAEHTADVTSPAHTAEAHGSAGALTRTEWTRRAGVIAAQREASGWTNPDLPLGRCPGVSTPEKRAAWHTAYTAAGMPDERRPEAEMTDGRLLVRARAAERARTAAPPAVYDAQRERHRLAAAAARDAVLAEAHGRHDDAARHQAVAARHTQAAERLDDIADARARWLLAHTETTTAGDAARAELTRRGITPGTEPDRTTAVDYLDWAAAEARARREDDAHRPITETDLVDSPSRSSAHAADPAERTAHAATLDSPSAVDAVDEDHRHLDDHTGQRQHAPGTAPSAAPADTPGPAAATPRGRKASATSPHDGLSAEAAEAEIAVAAAHAHRAAALLADQATQTEPTHEEHLDEAADTETADEWAAGADADWEADRARQIAAEHDAVATGVWHDQTFDTRTGPDTGHRTPDVPTASEGPAPATHHLGQEP